MAKHKVPEIVRKQVVPEVEKTDGAFRFTISDATVDRHGDTIDPNGWDVSDFMKSPVVLWNHDPSELPVGKATRVFVQDGKLKADVVFTTEDENPFGAQVAKLVEGGFLKATSVGFKPVEYKINEARATDSFMPPVDFQKQSLLEFSIVSIPANPNAVLEAKAAGLPIESIAKFCETWLEKHLGEGRWMTKSEAEALRYGPAAVVSAPPIAAPLLAVVPAPAEEITAKDVAEITREYLEQLRVAEMKRTGKLD